MRALYIPVIAITLTFLTGCGSDNVRNQTGVVSPPDTQAIAMLNNGEYAQAAAEFLKLAESDQENSDYYQLSAASAYILDRNFDQADSTINNLDLSEADAIMLSARNILLAKIALARNQPDRAESLLKTNLPVNASTTLNIDWYQTRAELYVMQNRPLDAALARIMLGSHLKNPSAIQDNTDQVWNLLNSIELNVLTRTANSSLEILRPWVELVAINKSLISRKDELEKAINNWTIAYPEHPANPFITEKILASSNGLHTLPGHIALLLPLTGMYESYSEKIRDGFLSAWLSEHSYKPVVRIYNTDTSNISEVYQNAITAGADFIVGPLEKDAVKVLAQMQPATVRILALNQIDPQDNQTSTTMNMAEFPGLIQFGLPPEDEAREVARRGILEGYNKVLIISPSDDFSTRVYNAFTQEWISLGGRILERVDYEPRTEDFIAPIKQLFNIDSSEARIATLRKRLGRNIAVTGRIRKDADFIFIIAPNLTARQIVPHIRFFRADTLPIYSISTVYNGKPDPLVDVDLNGVEFVDMPWLFNSTTDTHQELAGGWTATSTTFPRYYAFGIDAFRLIPQIGKLALDNSAKYPGETGTLYMADDGIIHRTLTWARFVDGQPQLIEIGNPR